MGQNDKSTSSTFPWKEILGVLGVVIAAYIGYLGIRSQIEIPIQTTQTAEARLVVSPIVGDNSINPTSTFVQTNATTAPTQTSFLSNVTPTSVTATQTSAPTGFGILVVKQIEGCNSIFNIVKPNGEKAGFGQDNSESYIATGTYDIVLNVSIGGPLIRKGVEIKSGEKTEIDFSRDLNLVILKEHSQFKQSLYYGLLSDNTSVSSSLSAGGQYCAVAGRYNINLLYSIPKFPGGERTTFNIDISTKDKIIIEPEIWSKYVGVLSTPVDYIVLRAKVIDLETGEQIEDSFPLPRWVPVGKYKIVTLQQPYIGLEFVVEIKPGEETILPLPK